VLRPVPEFAALQGQWNTLRKAPTTQQLTNTDLEATDLDAIDLAARNNQQVTIHGRVADADWDAQNGAMNISLRRVPSTKLRFVVAASMRVPVEAGLGGRLEDVLPEAELVVRGKPVFSGQRIVLTIANANQILSCTKGAATQPSSDLETTGTGVRGIIATAEWSRSGKVMNIELEPGKSTPPLITIFQRDGDAIASALAGREKLDEFLPGKTVEITGDIIDFPIGLNPKYEGRKEIIVTKATQIHILSPAPATAPATLPIGD
jgi:hypothetical protein